MEKICSANLMQSLPCIHILLLFPFTQTSEFNIESKRYASHLSSVKDLLSIMRSVRWWTCDPEFVENNIWTLIQSKPKSNYRGPTKYIRCLETDRLWIDIYNSRKSSWYRFEGDWSSGIDSLWWVKLILYAFAAFQRKL